MMKKVFLVCMLVAMVAGSASANYIWNVGLYDQVGSSGASTTIGVFSPAGTNEFTYPTSASAVAAEVKYTGEIGPSMVKTNLLKKDWVAADPSKWIIEAWAPSGFGGTAMSLRLWAATAATTKPTGTWKLFKLYDPTTGVWGRDLVDSIDTAAKSVNGTQAAPWLTVPLALSKTDAPYGATSGYLFELSVPEPGSMVAMLSGLVGLVGFGIRRRK